LPRLKLELAKAGDESPSEVMGFFIGSPVRRREAPSFKTE
jgi:hypothetical protein